MGREIAVQSITDMESYRGLLIGKFGCIAQTYIEVVFEAFVLRCGRETEEQGSTQSK